MNTFRNYPYASTMVLSAVGLFLFLILTNPEKVAIGLLIVPVALFFLIVYSLAHILIYRLNLIKSMPNKRRIVALVSSGLITVVMILQSTGGISVADVILLALIVVVSAVYIDKF